MCNCCQVIKHENLLQHSDAMLEHAFLIWFVSILSCITQCAHKLNSLRTKQENQVVNDLLICRLFKNFTFMKLEILQNCIWRYC